MVLVMGLVGLGLAIWAHSPIQKSGESKIFEIKPGAGVFEITRQIKQADIAVNAWAFHLLVRFSGNAKKLKAGNYEFKPGTTPWQLLDQIVQGDFKQESLVIIEGWTFRQMRALIDATPLLKHDTLHLTDKELLALISSDFTHPEGLFFPDTYLFVKGTSDLEIYRRAHTALLKRLSFAWESRDIKLPYKTPYEALIMASIIEKETGRRIDRPYIAAVFVNRLQKGMLLQTDPTVIYGMGAHFDGNIRRRDLIHDTPYNTYTRRGLPPTPIALTGGESLQAAFSPAKTDALYFIGRGDGTSLFSKTLDEHNNAVNQFIRKGK